MRLNFIFLEIFKLYLQINQIKFQEIELNFIFSKKAVNASLHQVEHLILEKVCYESISFYWNIFQYMMLMSCK
jgi:hypothetical protein